MRWILSVFIALACASCAADHSASTAQHPEPLPGQAPVTVPPTKQASAAAPTKSPPAKGSAVAAKAEASKFDAPPKDAQFTIYCDDFTGESHVVLANHAKAQMAQQTGMKGWYCIHQQDHSTLFFGYYKEANEPTALRDLAKIRDMHDQFGGATFRSVLMVTVDAPDPAAPPEWNLANLRQSPNDQKHCYTIQIAAYKDSPQRKQAAVEAVKEARKQGIEAYYYHGDTASSVCIGCWPMEAVKIQGAAMQRDGQQYFGGPEGQDVIMAPGVVIDPRVVRQFKRDNKTYVQPEFQIVDQSMIDVKERFPEHSVNGMTNWMVDSQGVKRPRPSIVVEIPVKAMSGLAGGMNPGAPVPDAAPPPEALKNVLPDPKLPPAPGSGRLKSVGQ